VNVVGGYRVQGRSDAEAEQLRTDAAALVRAGVFAIVLECMPDNLAAAITAEVPVPTIGIGAGAGCDGQVLVMHDMLGMNAAFKPRFVKEYAHIGPIMRQAFADYAREVEEGVFPAGEHAYGASAGR
jgi:3-methyl-2-oxobutanoate hydroxymethyltransferase